MTGNLVSLALAAEARGRAQKHLDRARTMADAARAELETAAAELVQDAANRLVQRARPGEQIALPMREASYALRTVANDLRGLHDERTHGLTRRRVAHLDHLEGVVTTTVDPVTDPPRRGGRLERADVLTGLADQPVLVHVRERRCLRGGCGATRVERFSGWVGGLLVSWSMCEPHAAEYPLTGSTW